MAVCPDINTVAEGTYRGKDSSIFIVKGPKKITKFGACQSPSPKMSKVLGPGTPEYNPKQRDIDRHI